MTAEQSGWTAPAHWRSVGRTIARGESRVRRGSDDEKDAPEEAPPKPAPEPKRPTFRDRIVEKDEG